VLFGYLAPGATLQELPGYVAARFHAGALVVGVTVGLAFAGTAAARPLAGRAGDAGRSRGTAIAGGLLAAAAAAGRLLAPDLWVLLAARLVMGLGEAALFSGTLPWVLAGCSRRARAGSRAGSACDVGRVGHRPVARRGGRARRRRPCGVVAGDRLAGRVGRAGRQHGRPETARPLRAWAGGWQGLLPRGAGTAGVILGLASYGYGTLTALLVLFLGTRGLGGQTVQALGLAAFSAALLMTRAAGSPLVDTYGGLTVARWVLLAESAGLILLATASSALWHSARLQ
jgi:hypothetical protein